MAFQLYSLLVVLIFTPLIIADTPANCTYDEISGIWNLHETQRGFDSSINCKEAGAPINTITLNLLFPDTAIDQHGNRGRWTLIYNQGFEITINYRKYFAFSKFENQTSYCDRTLAGYSHDVLGHNWACFAGLKTTQIPPKISLETQPRKSSVLFRNQPNLIESINHKQNSWTARRYEQFEGMSYDQMFLMKGGPKSRIANPPPPKQASETVKKLAQVLPEEFDWRNISGINFVSPVRNQGSCGSCYAFSSLAMIEARIRVITNNSEQITLSTQDIVSCSEYSQGCAGGFPYLIAGKYGQDFGFTQEQCFPYTGTELACKEKDCLRYYVADYHYVGGFYGGCNEELMKIQLVKNGPMSVSFEVYDDFMTYSGGIYHHTGLQDGFNPFAITNHAVLLVGYGVDKRSGENYWIVKNSWGTGWGENGFFKIRRGTNECNIESIAVEAFPIPNTQ